jgi:hypothetical protein
MDTLRLGVIAFKAKDVTHMRSILDTHTYEYSKIFGKLHISNVDGELIVSFLYKRSQAKDKLDELTA